VTTAQFCGAQGDGGPIPWSTWRIGGDMSRENDDLMDPSVAE
jgi:hypothetical protein